MACRCPFCDYPNFPEAKSCRRCSKPLPRMCPSCCAVVAPGSGFCSSCGKIFDETASRPAKKQGTEKKLRQCPVCKHKIAFHAMTCTYCGNKLTKPTPEDEIQANAIEPEKPQGPKEDLKQALKGLGLDSAGKKAVPTRPVSKEAGNKQKPVIPPRPTPSTVQPKKPAQPEKKPPVDIPSSLKAEPKKPAVAPPKPMRSDSPHKAAPAAQKSEIPQKPAQPEQEKAAPKPRPEPKPAQPEPKPAQPEPKPAQPEPKPAQPEPKPAQPQAKPDVVKETPAKPKDPSKVLVKVTRMFPPGEYKEREARPRFPKYPAGNFIQGNVEVPKGMILIPGGKFLYGPKKSIRVIPTFLIDKTPVTCRQYLEFCEETEYPKPWNWGDETYLPGQDDFPVTHVTLNDARNYAAWAGKRIPLETEWEKAAGGADGRLYPWGNEPGENRCLCKLAEKTKNPVSVFSFPDGASPYGCLDMVGNVAELTESTEITEKPFARPFARGGSREDPPSVTTCRTKVEIDDLDYYSHLIGFRCAKDVE